MRICHLLAADTTEEHLTTIGHLLARLDRHHFVNCLASVSAPTAERAADFLGVEVRRVNLRMAGYIGSAKGDWLEDGRPDLVHVWSGRRAPINSLLAADRMAVVLTGEMEAPPSGGVGPSADRILSRSVVICDSQAQRDQAVRSGHESSRCQVIPPGAACRSGGVDNGPTRADLGLPEDQPVLLAPGPPSREGGQYYAVWATALLQQLFPGIRLLLPGESRELARLERFARSFWLPEILVPTGNRWSLSELAGIADVMVAPSTTQTPTGPVVRSMAAGLAVVAGDVASIRERIVDGVTGLLVPPQNATRLAGAVLRIIEDDDPRDRLVAAARRHVAEEYTIDKLIERYESVYERAYCRRRTLAMGR